MIVSETTGYLRGLEYEPCVGLKLTADWYGQGIYTQSCSVTLPWNKNLPYELDLESLRDKKVKITVELIEEK